MKRKLLVAAFLLAAALLVGGVALAADDPIVCSMEVSPSALAAPGEVTVTITISNSGDTDMKDPLTLYSPTSEVVTDFGDGGSAVLKAGEVKTWTGKWAVNQRTLDNGQIVFFVKYFLYKSNGEREAQSQPIRGKLNVTEARTDVEIRRTISPGTAREGQTVTVIYDIVNNGTVPLKNLRLTENKDVAKKAVAVAEELKPGEAAQVKFPVTMGKKVLTSSATLTYTVGDGKETQTQTVDAQTITYGEAALTAILSASSKGVAVNGTLTLTLELTNNGTVNYTDVRVSDATLGEVFTNQELAAGGKLKLEKQITLTATTNYQFHIVAIDNTGTEVALDSDSITVTAVDPSKMVHLNVIVAANRTEVYTQPGIVRFTVTVENDSEVDAKDVTIYHGGTRIYTFPSIPAGQSRSLTRDAALSMAGKYQFTAVTVDALQNSNSFLSNEIQIAFEVPTPAPATPTPPLVPTPEPTYARVTPPSFQDPSIAPIPKAIASIFMPLQWVSLVLLVATIVLLFLATQKRAEQKRASAAALDHLDRAKRRNYIAPGEEEEVRVQPVTAAATAGTAHEPSAPKAARNAAPQAEPAEEPELPHEKYVRNAYERSKQGQAGSFGKGSLFDQDPLVGGGYGDEPTQQADVYHAYGSDSDLPPVERMPKAQPKDWSAYRKQATGAESEPQGYDTRTAYRRDGYGTQEGAAYGADAYGVQDGAEYGADAYGDGTDAYADDAQYAQGTDDANGTEYAPYDRYAAQDGVDGQLEYLEDEGFVSDPLGYGGQASDTDGQATYDEPAYYGDAGTQGGYADGNGGYAQATEEQPAPRPGGGRAGRRSSREPGSQP